MHSTAANTNTVKIRHLQQSLDILRQSESVLLMTAGDADDTNLDELLDQMVRQLQTTLRTLIKLCLGQQKHQRTVDTPDVETFKHLYSLTLRRATSSEQRPYTAQDVLCSLLKAMPTA